MDSLSGTGAAARAGSLAVAAVVLVGLIAAISEVRTRLSLVLQRRLDRRLTVGFFSHLVSLPHDELERRGPAICWPAWRA